MINFWLSNCKVKVLFRLGLGLVEWQEQKIFFLLASVAKDTQFFLLRAPTHNSFTFNLWFLYELKHKVHHFSKNLCWLFHFWLYLVFTICLVLSLYFCSAKIMDSLTLRKHEQKTVNLLKKENLSWKSFFR